MNSQKKQSVLSTNLESEDYSRTGVLFSEGSVFSEMIKEARTGHELWRFFIILTIVFVLCELVILKFLEK